MYYEMNVKDGVCCDLEQSPGDYEKGYFKSKVLKCLYATDITEVGEISSIGTFRKK